MQPHDISKQDLMQNTTDKVRKTYFDRFDEMELEYQLHFASRLSAWNGDQAAKQKLADLEHIVVPSSHDERIKNLEDVRLELAAKDFERDVNNYQARKPFFEKYPDLLLVHNALFRIRHWYCIYGIDEREGLFEVLPKQQVEAMITELSGDKEAVRVLSTYAINVFYLYEKLYADDKDVIDIDKILGLKESYDHSDKKDLQMLIYLYAHCILGETLFYAQPVQKRLGAYLEMLKQIETILERNYDDVNLDNKFEFLVCARICDYQTKLASKIYDEAERSLNDEGFIVDKFNQNSSPAKQTFLMSEHRNVLFIMSHTEPLFNKGD